MHGFPSNSIYHKCKTLFLDLKINSVNEFQTNIKYEKTSYNLIKKLVGLHRINSIRRATYLLNYEINNFITTAEIEGYHRTPIEYLV